jgi:hypothetical protein
MLSRSTRWFGLPALAAAAYLAATTTAADHYGLSPQSISLQSAGPLAFGPDGILFVGDPKGATVYAIDTKPYRAGSASQLSTDSYNHADVRAAIAELAATETDQVQVADIAVDPESGTLFLSAGTGKGAKLIRFAPGAEPQSVNLDKASASSVKLENPPEDKVTGEGRRAGNRRMESITDLAFAEGAVLVSGLSGASPLSTVQSFHFPFRESGTQANIEIFHAAHGRTEDYAAIRAFIPINIDGQPSLLAGFTCTPLVQFSLDSLQRQSKVRGTTVAELGNRNRPLDMIVYEKDDATYLLVTNSARGVMKIDTADIADQAEITEPVPGGGTAGLPFEQIDSLTNVVQLDKLNNHLGVVLIEGSDKSLAMKTIELP